MNYEDLTVYQIYPKSFCDTNGDGIGDICGVIEKLDYIKSLGANAIWLCPIYKSPQKDNGYDISDYFDIDPVYGTIEEFERLLTVAHEKGIKVIMDLVANHTSDKHFWFQEAKKSKDNPYHDYYYWADKPLTDWRACFGGSAWEYNEETNEYYLHSFAVQQPDVNWTNPKVREEFAKIVDFWQEKGVDGFRCDVLDYISKDFENGKILDGPHLHEYIRELFGTGERKKLFTVGECQSTTENIRAICGKDRDELKCVFQFEHFGIGRTDKNTPKEHTIDEVKNTLIKWQEFCEKYDLTYVLLTDNHDQPWYNSRVGNDEKYRYESATMLATTFYLLKGIPFIYQGQEIGCANSYFSSVDCFDDIETRNYYFENKDKYDEAELIRKTNYGSRDNSRRPFAWDNTANHGFTDGTPWLPYATRSDEINLKNDTESEKSVFRFYQKLLNYRKENLEITRGTVKVLSDKEGCFVYEREYEGKRTVVVCNFEKEQEIFDLPDKSKIVFSNVALNGNKFSPYQCVVYKIN